MPILYTDLNSSIRATIAALNLDQYLSSVDYTASCIAETYQEVFSGTQIDPRSILKVTIPATSVQEGQLIVLSSISLVSVCEHHFLPFFGYVDLCYVVNTSIIGLGQLTELVKALMRRPQLQEKITDELAFYINEALQPKGIGIHVVARHFCELMRGTREENQVFSTYRYVGALENNQMYRDSFMKSVEHTLLKLK
ncbi:MAG: GTP cyclohydrolase I [Chloroflexi bacterium]|nr:GTP cyclohydrolase I [Chloroflexota bacterium]